MTDNKETRKRGRESQEDKPGDEVDLDARKGDGNREFKWDNRQYHMTYKGWLDLAEVQRVTREAYPGASFEAFSFVHEESDELNAYRHTHWYFKMDKKSERRGARLLDVGEIHPNARKVFRFGNHGAYLMDVYHRKQKDAYLVQWGRENLKTQGEREKERWAGIRDMAISGDVAGVLEHHPAEYFRCSRVVKEVAMHKGAEPPAMKSLQVGKFFWLYGPPNTGKTTFARKFASLEYPGEQPYTMPAGMKFVQGYKYQKAFIIEEAAPENCAGRSAFFKTLLDLHPVQVDVKNSYQLIRPELVIVTSNYHPTACFPSLTPGRESIDAQAILARVILKHLTKVYASQKPLDYACSDRLQALIEE